MATITLEERVAILEQELLALRRQFPKPAGVPWWEQISGVFADTPALDESVELSRQYREAQRPAADEGGDVSA